MLDDNIRKFDDIKSEIENKQELRNEYLRKAAVTDNLDSVDFLPMAVRFLGDLDLIGADLCVRPFWRALLTSCGWLFQKREILPFRRKSLRGQSVSYNPRRTLIFLLADNSAETYRSRVEGLMWLAGPETPRL